MEPSMPLSKIFSAGYFEWIEGVEEKELHKASRYHPRTKERKAQRLPDRKKEMAENEIDQRPLAATESSSMRDKFINSKAKLQSNVEELDRKCCSDHSKVLSRLWIIMQVLTLAVVICGIAVAIMGGDSGYSFLGFYVAILALGVSVVGAIILRKYRSASNHGLLVGLSFMMANVMLINAIVVGTRREQGTNAAEKALGAFSVFLFAVYVVFTVLLRVWKDEIIVGYDDTMEIEMGDELGDDSEARANGEEARTQDLKMV